MNQQRAIAILEQGIEACADAIKYAANQHNPDILATAVNCLMRLMDQHAEIVTNKGGVWAG